jgi:hypothetical protein
MEHITLVNLVRTGQKLEVVRCTDAATCTPISPALALGDVFDAEVPADARDDCAYPLYSIVPCFPASLTAGGGGIGYRVVPSAALPNPPVLALGSSAPPAVNVVVPLYFSDEGQLLLELF